MDIIIYAYHVLMQYYIILYVYGRGKHIYVFDFLHSAYLPSTYMLLNRTCLSS